MAEKNILVDNLTVTYKGLFDLPDTINALHKAIMERGYSRHEKKTEQKVEKGAIQFFYDLRIQKSKTYFFKLRMYIKVVGNNLTEKTVEVDGFPRKFQQGDLQVIFDAYTHTDYEKRWNQKPYTFFLKTFIHKFIWRYPIEYKPHAEVVSDCRYVYDQVKAHLKLYKYQVGKAVPKTSQGQLP